MHFSLHALQVNFLVNCITGCHTFPLVQIKQMWPLFIQLTLHTKTSFVWHPITYEKNRLPLQLWYKLLWLNTPVISYIICCQIAISFMKVYWLHNLDTSFPHTHTHKLWYINAPDYLQAIVLSSDCQCPFSFFNHYLLQS